MFQSSRVDGTIQDHDGNPVPDTVVELLEENWVAGLRELDRTDTVKADKSGKFEFGGGLPGTYYLRARPVNALVQQQLKDSAQAPEADRRDAFADSLYPNALFLEQAQPLSLTGGANVLSLRLEMQKTKYHSLSGHVFGIPPEAQQFSGLVLIRRVGFDSPFPFVWKSPYDGAISVRIMPDGSFNAPNVPPGPYWAGYTPAGAVRGGSQFEISDRNVDDLRFEVDKGAVLKGKAVFEDGTPVTNLSANLGVFLPNMGIYERGFFVDRNSAFQQDGMPAGTWRMEIPNMVVRTVNRRPDVPRQ